MTEIYSLQGQLYTINNTLQFICTYQNTQLCIHILEHQRNTSNPGDIVTIIFNPINQNIRGQGVKILLEYAKMPTVCCTFQHS